MGDTPQDSPAGATELLTITETAAELGVSRRRVERLVQAGVIDTMRQRRHGKTLHLIHRAVLPALKSRLAAQPSGIPAGEATVSAPSVALAVITERAEKAEARADAAEQRERELLTELAAIANAGPIRAGRLRRRVRARLSA